MKRIKSLALILSIIGSTACAYDLTIPIWGSTLYTSFASDVSEYHLSSTLICDLSPEEIVFAKTVVAHFTNVRPCWRQRRIPTKYQINKIILGCLLSCRRYWPRQPERLYQGFTLIISETGGNNVGNPKDPSYGVCCACYTSSHHACHVFGIPHLYRKTDFVDELKNNILFNVTCSFGELAICEARGNGDWVRTVLMYKMGLNGLSGAIDRNPDLPLTEFSTWKAYSRLYLWLMCIRDRILVDNPITCGCANAADFKPIPK